MMRQLEVVPSPVMSSCAVATLAINDAVGCWICWKVKDFNNCMHIMMMRIIIDYFYVYQLF